MPQKHFALVVPTTDSLSEDELQRQYPGVKFIVMNPEPEPAPEPVVLEKVLLKGKSIATVRVDNMVTKIVIFHPTAQTHKKVEAYEDVLDIELSIEDVNGLFVSPRQVVITGSTYERGNDTMIVTTEVQS